MRIKRQQMEAEKRSKSDEDPRGQLEAKPQAVQSARVVAEDVVVDRVPSRSQRAEPAWRVDLTRNRSRLRGLRTREADALREQAELVRQALDVGASVSAICRVLGISRPTFYGRYGEMLRRRAGSERRVKERGSGTKST